ncbi:sugar ABC transporter substrate-binding protein [Devosia pacifica]|uniref:Sugar ABC transporter substrate-binding protein n=1 Tax=Devosia pacifica TaxID=1335967 RepID=A0A918VXP1_9HYPH|nr:substrate-binding domain-containing protein [Devosia pacifica]GHA39275.1 sugar ABC transporter substrate-binding protein [Devosia pacifica]
MNKFNSKVLLGAALLGSMSVAGVHAQSPDEALAALAEQTLSLGPNGEEPVAASEVSLTDEELAEIREMDATAAIVMHYGGDDWSQAQIAGLEAQFEDMGIEVIATTDAGFSSSKQVSDIETIMAQRPDIIVSIPTDPTATASAYRQAAEAGTTLVFMDNVPTDFVPGEDYVSVVSADNYGNGVASAHLMAKALDEEGQIGIVYHAADFFVTRQRYDAFKATIEENYPQIEIVAEQGIGGPDFTGDADRTASSMMVSNPGIDGIWAVWDVPAEGVIAAARANGRDDLVITTIDLGENVAIDMARDGFIKGLGAQRPYDQGVTEALLAGYGLLDKEAPDYVALPALPVEKDNLLDAWQTVYATKAPSTIVDSMN